MADKSESFLKRRWKLIVNIITLIALAILIYAIRDQLAQTLKDFRRVNVWVLLLMIPMQLLNYHGQAKLYQGLFGIVGNKLKYWFLFRASVELNFVNHVFPSGGVSGVSYFGVRMKDDSITGSKATLVQVMKVALLILSFELLLIAGLFFLAIVGKASGFVLFIAGVLSTLMVLGTVGFTYIIGSKRRINSFFITATKGLNRLIQIVRRRHPETINVERAHQAFDDLHENYLAFRNHGKQLQAPFWWAVLANITEVATLYVVYIAFDEWVNVGAVILAYAVANFAGFVSILPGGVGIYEALMTAVLSAGGVPAAVSLPVTVMYRVLNTIIQLPPGYYFYSKTIKGNKS
jgi:uncharacterized protein (TIRG00374 family)